LGQNVTVDVVNLDVMSRQRRKEIEEMSEEDIQAETKKTEETLRKKVVASGSRTQRSGMQSLPLTMAILCLVGRQVDAFTAYDCSLRSRRGLVQEDKRMAFVYTHGLFIT
jgi:hypothetical protein